jgi:hypothetical protein
MKQVPDRKRLRREYLRSRIHLQIASRVASGVFLVMLIAMIFFLLLSLGCAIQARRFGGSWWDWFWCGIYALLALTSGRTAYRSCFWHEEAKGAARLPMVPPFHVDVLPADEILVRGSEQPTIQSEVLLRVAKSEETLKEELLQVVKTEEG